MSSRRWGMSIDPGVPSGIAVWEGERLQQYTTIEARIRSMDYISRASVIVAQTAYLMPHNGWLAIEWPERWEGSAKSIAADAQGDLARLQVMVGMFVQVGFERGMEVRLYKPREWKGQLPKNIVRTRVERSVGPCQFKATHEWEAVGIGLFHLMGVLR